ncbi:aminotransferase class I/II-fold pyridoxal phosphate-dependent enzyme [Vibrio agarivorans]|uniref:histidinol-phosphate transaminase n=1 Tax=Vibrio agarivorans TaxID=153622 RepID=A0ABT7Y5L8_9VIBR|nr:aminotransferase class I/II-fold pyridoxal phosphate-dependent enzyme [Vibrio agarivorans]MDN2483302.1 aminotransferase class I/II-fold pyridoxal phosphate-dependent enzyme [Vibrio agarivorans]
MKLNRQLEQEQASYVNHSYLIDCSLGSNPFGCPDISAEATHSFIEDIDQYYSFHHYAEIAYLTSCYLGVDSRHLTFTNGSLGALELIFNKLIDAKSRSMIGIGPQFVEGVSEFIQIGGHYQAIDMFRYPCEHSLFAALEAKVQKEKPSLVYIDNPNNPTGRIYDKSHLISLCQVCEKAGSILIIDEVYGEFLQPEQSMSSETLWYSNLLVLRSFSKGLGLAGVRLGYILSSPKLTPFVQSAVTVFAPSLPALKIACHILPKAQAFVADNLLKTERFKKQMVKLCKQCGFDVVPSSDHTPIMLLHMPMIDVAKRLEELNIRTCSGEHFSITCQQVDEQYARVRIVGNDRDLDQIRLRLESL